MEFSLSSRILTTLFLTNLLFATDAVIIKENDEKAGSSLSLKNLFSKHKKGKAPAGAMYSVSNRQDRIAEELNLPKPPIPLSVLQGTYEHGESSNQAKTNISYPSVLSNPGENLNLETSQHHGYYQNHQHFQQQAPQHLISAAPYLEYHQNHQHPPYLPSQQPRMSYVVTPDAHDPRVRKPAHYYHMNTRYYIDPVTGKRGKIIDYYMQRLPYR